MTATNHLEVPQRIQVLEFRIVSLDIQKAGDLLDGGQDLKLGRVHRSVPRTECKVFVKVLEPGETGLQYGE